MLERSTFLVLFNVCRRDVPCSAEVLLLGDEDQGLCREVRQSVQHRKQNQGHGRSAEENVWSPNSLLQKTSQVRL